ncbi:MAG: di-trans,poly-cis-decaprenylcistransferase [Chloroflexi bacterium]|nr:di-trans,poly-cis-decaprenylcistransferase [Chloroflexota bacterium]
MVVEPAASEVASLPGEAPPRHVAIIMDGNGRWARERGLSRQRGHRAGADAIRAVVERLGEHGVPIVTLFAFSTENWGRPRGEVEYLMRLAGRVIDRELDSLDEAGIRLCHIGDLSPLPRSLKRKVEAAVARTAANDRITVNLAFNYGGRSDIVGAVRQLIAEGVAAGEVDAEAIASRLATAELPDPDLLIRTAGERRLSNFLVWESAYSEYYFTSTLWPDFGPEDVDEALREYRRRRRRFGLVPDRQAEHARPDA